MRIATEVEAAIAGAHRDILPKNAKVLGVPTLLIARQEKKARSHARAEAALNALLARGLTPGREIRKGRPNNIAASGAVTRRAPHILERDYNSASHKAGPVKLHRGVDYITAKMAYADHARDRLGRWYSGKRS